MSTFRLRHSCFDFHLLFRRRHCYAEGLPIPLHLPSRSLPGPKETEPIVDPRGREARKPNKKSRCTNRLWFRWIRAPFVRVSPRVPAVQTQASHQSRRAPMPNYPTCPPLPTAIVSDRPPLLMPDSHEPLIIRFLSYNCSSF